MIVTATPVTGVVGSPSLKVSTVSWAQGTPMFCLMRARTSCAVNVSARARSVLPATAPRAVYVRNSRRLRLGEWVTRGEYAGFDVVSQARYRCRMSAKRATWYRWDELPFEELNAKLSRRL